jgi:hypothetical protein
MALAQQGKTEPAKASLTGHYEGSAKDKADHVISDGSGREGWRSLGHDQFVARRFLHHRDAQKEKRSHLILARTARPARFPRGGPRTGWGEPEAQARTADLKRVAQQEQAANGES